MYLVVPGWSEPTDVSMEMRMTAADRMSYGFLYPHAYLEILLKTGRLGATHQGDDLHRLVSETGVTMQW